MVTCEICVLCYLCMAQYKIDCLGFKILNLVILGGFQRIFFEYILVIFVVDQEGLLP